MPVLFSCFGHLRDLHSFPTRRSSDLVEHVDAARDLQGATLARAGAEQERREENENDARGPVVQGCFSSSARYCSMKARSPASDRKSTRLNSSHVSISYAVFCLKKKKK